LNFFNRFRCRLDILEDDECLALGFEVGFRDDVYDVAVFGEDLGEAFT